MQTRRTVLRRSLLALVAALGAFAGPAVAAYPDQPIKLLIGFPPGGGGDLYGRAIAQELSKSIGQPVVVDNRPGAGGVIAADLVAHSKPDGYTLLIAMSGNMGSVKAVRKNMPYNVPDSFTFVAQLVETPFGMMVGTQSKITNVKDFIATAKQGKMSYASTGTGGAAQIVMEMVKQAGKLDIMHVPYKGSGPALTDLYGGQVDSFFAPYTPLMGQITGGKLRLLAVSSEKRVPSMPDMPTLKESGVDVVMTQWYGLAGPAGMPRDIVDTLLKHVKIAMQQPSVQKVYNENGAQAATRTGDAFREFVVQDLANYQRAVDIGGIKEE
jgi:tripartite-type tricarboxylate transporter receptor subunit TctC